VRGSRPDLSASCLPKVPLLISCVNLPPACSAEIEGDIGSGGRRWRLLGIPLADAKLLAMEDERSRAVCLVRVRRGGYRMASAVSALLVDEGSAGAVFSAATGLAGADGEGSGSRVAFSCQLFKI